MAKNIANGVEYEYSESGGICMLNPKTIKRYHELKDEHPKDGDYGVFFAFGNEQFEKGRKALVAKGYMKEGEKVCSAGMGMYGTREEISRYLDFYKERGKRIAKECDPQEVYFYECNNHECMITYNDDEALKVVIGYFGNEAAHKVERVYGGTATNVLAPLTERDRHLGEYEHTLRMLGRMEFDMHGFFSEGDCRYHRPDDLWGNTIGSEIAKMRELYDALPDDIKDASCMTKQEIDDYARRLQAWADEEFRKPDYDPVPRTCREDFPQEIELSEKLYYRDDEGNYQTPAHVWFTGDTRRCKQDRKACHGRAMTSYLGKHGTTLAPVLISDYGSIGMKPYCRKDLCDVTCKYEYKPLHGRLYDFHYE